MFPSKDIAPHPACPRRPTRTRAAERPTQHDSGWTTYSDIELMTAGHRRTIRLRRDRTPVVDIQTMREGGTYCTQRVFPRQAAGVLKAITMARTDARRFFDCRRVAVLDLPDGAAYVVGAKRAHGKPIVTLQLVGADGEFLGKTHAISDSELTALAQALLDLQKEATT